jgi:signal transduction histidine kinase
MTTGGSGLAPGPRRPRLGLRREVLIVLPAALLLLAVLSTATLAAYFNAVSQLTEERRAEAARLAGAVADRLSGGEGPHGVLPLRTWAPSARALLILDESGRVLSASGEPAGGTPLAPVAGRRLERPLGLGPDRERLPGLVAGFASWDTAAGRRFVRVDFDATALAAQKRSAILLASLVLSVDVALAAVVLLFLRHLLQPYEMMLERARQMGAAADGDDIELLLSTFERAVKALAAPPAAADEEFAALERTLSHSLQSGLLLLDRDGGFLAVNPLGMELLGLGHPSPGTPLAELLQAQPALRDLLAEAVATGQAPNRRECPAASGGKTLTLGLTVHPLRRDDGGVRGHLVLFADLTESRRRAEESRFAGDLARLAEMAGGVAHELRNGLATLRGYLTLIERRPDEESIADFLAEIRRETEHLELVLSDFLSFARPGSARMQDLCLTDLAARAAADPALAGLAVRVAGGEREVWLRGDPHLLERALRNLLRNAAQAERDAGGQGPVDLGIAVSPEGVEVSIADRGSGVPGDIRDRLFHPFVTGRRGGVGLGLALAHRIVVLHGGKIRLADRPGGGTRAVIFFPTDTMVTKDLNEEAEGRVSKPG